LIFILEEKQSKITFPITIKMFETFLQESFQLNQKDIQYFKDESQRTFQIEFIL